MTGDYSAVGDARKRNAPVPPADDYTRLRAAFEAYAAEREANGRRGRTVHSARIASDLRAILAAHPTSPEKEN